MTRKSFTAVIERNAKLSENFETEPYESAWAGEARWFIRITELTGDGAEIRITPQVSPDGLFWCDEGTHIPTITEAGLYSFSLRDFGHWLRLSGEVTGTAGKEPAEARVIIYLALKS